MNAPFEPSIQQKAVLGWTIEDKGSLELVARAGCGKTSMLMLVVDTIVQNKLGDVALMAYNKPIATEMKNRLQEKGYDWKLVHTVL